MSRHIKQEKIHQIYELWESGLHNKSEISRQVGVSEPTVSRLLKQREQTGAKVCPKCKRESRQDARFCYYCGNDLRSREELLAIKVEKLRSMILHLPENMRGEFDSTTREIMGYLREKGA